MEEQFRKLATIRKIKEIRPIEGADAIELAVVDGWNVVVAKNVGHKVGDKVVYCEIDSFLPIREEFEFLRKSSYKKMGNLEGFRLKTIRLRGQISQGLILPSSILEGLIEIPIGFELDRVLEGMLGQDVSEMIGIVKYEPPIPAQLSGQVKGGFPGFLRKTDEERIQNLEEQYQRWRSNPELSFYVTEKLDGSSFTCYLKDGQFGVCSRNLELAEPEPFVPGMEMCGDGIERPRQENTFWKVVREMGIREKLEKACQELGRNLCIQGEMIGSGIQGNPYNLKGQTLRLYNIFDIDAQEYFGLPMFLTTAEHLLEIPTVPVLEMNFKLPETIEDLLAYAESKSVLNKDTEREGVVIRSLDRKISFKSISNKFLLGSKE
jgi:RNA ligase (TIGR02306 family)